MSSDLPAVVTRVVKKFRELGCDGELVHLPHNQDLADDLLKKPGTSSTATAHTKIYEADGNPILVVRTGPREADKTSLASALGVGHVTAVSDRIAQNWTRQEPKAIAPIGHPTDISVVIDVELSRHSTIWVPAGHPEYLIATSYAELLQITAGTVAEVVATATPDPDPLI